MHRPGDPQQRRISVERVIVDSHEVPYLGVDVFGVVKKYLEGFLIGEIGKLGNRSDKNNKDEGQKSFFKRVQMGGFVEVGEEGFFDNFSPGRPGVEKSENNPGRPKKIIDPFVGEKIDDIEINDEKAHAQEEAVDDSIHGGIDAKIYFQPIIDFLSEQEPLADHEDNIKHHNEGLEKKAQAEGFLNPDGKQQEGEIDDNSAEKELYFFKDYIRVFFS